MDIWKSGAMFIYLAYDDGKVIIQPWGVSKLYLVTPHHGIDLDQHWLTWTDVDLPSMAAVALC